MFVETSHAPDFQDQAFQAALTKLQQEESQERSAAKENRKSARFRYAADQAVVVVDPPAQNESDQLISFPVFARNLSRSGMSFVVTHDILPRVLKDGAVPLTVEKVLAPPSRVRVGLPLPNAEFVWLAAKLVRLRSIENGLYEGGLQFQAKLDNFSFPGSSS